MAVIYLIRHGQASFGQENYDQLSDLGKQQAVRLGVVLNQRLAAFDLVALGSMVRHRQTAEHCLQGFGVSFDEIQAEVDPGWNEYDHQEILRVYRPEFETAVTMTEFVGQQNNPKQFFEQEFNAAINRWISGEYDADYQETWQQFVARVNASFDSIQSQNCDAQHIAVFTSGGPISLITQALLGVSQEQIMRMNWTLMNCGVTKIVATRSRRFIASLNEHTHFEGSDYRRFITYT